MPSQSGNAALKKGYTSSKGSKNIAYGDHQYFIKRKNKTQAEGAEVPYLINLSHILLSEDDAERGAVAAEWIFYANKFT